MFLRIVVIGVAVLSGPTVVLGDIVVNFDGRTTAQSGTGFGTVLNLLSLQSQGSSTVETGSVTRGAGFDVITGDAKQPPTQTISVDQLFGAGVSATDYGFDLIFNINEPGSAGDVVLESFNLFFTDDLGNAIAGVNPLAMFSGPAILTEVAGQGTGSAGYVFDVIFSQDQWQLFTASGTNRIGAFASVSNVAGGQENFYIAKASGPSPVIPADVPEPSSLVLLGLVAGAGVAGRSLRRRRAASRQA